MKTGFVTKCDFRWTGDLKPDWTLVKAAILGAESFGFGTGPLISLGCKFLRICHLNNCATGVATQDETLRRAHFKGLPEQVMAYFQFMVKETRMIMAELGIPYLTDLIGRTDLLEVIDGIDVKGSERSEENDGNAVDRITGRRLTPKQTKLKLDALLYSPKAPTGSALFPYNAQYPCGQGRA